MQRGVLEAVVHHNHRCPRFRRGLRPRCAILRNPDIGKGGQQQRFIPHLRGSVARRINLHRPLQRAAVTARHHMGRVIPVAQVFDDSHDRWRLARAPGVDVADADHRNIQTQRRARRQPAGSGTRIKRAQRLQQACAPIGRGAVPKGGGAFHDVASRWSSVSCTRSITLSVTAAPRLITSHPACAIVAA